MKESESLKTTLDKLPINKVGIVKKINTNNNIKRRLMDLGLIANSNIKKVLVSPLGDPAAYQIRGSIIALRKKDTENIIVEIKGQEEI